MPNSPNVPSVSDIVGAYHLSVCRFPACSQRVRVFGTQRGPNGVAEKSKERIDAHLSAPRNKTNASSSVRFIVMVVSLADG
jgi:hypothetical protein